MRARFASVTILLWGLIVTVTPALPLALPLPPLPEALPEASAAQPQPPLAPVRVGGNIRQPTKLKHATPIYPPEAEAEGVAGIVILEINIGTDGTVTDARVLRGVPMLNTAAIEAVRQWEYTPTLLNGVAVPVILTVTVNFTPRMNGGTPPDLAPSSIAPREPGETPPGVVPANPFLLTPMRAGVLSLGMRMPQVFGIIPRDQIVGPRADGTKPTTLEIALAAGEPTALTAVLSQEADPRVAEIEIQSDRFRTRDGLGVGSTLGDVRARYPQLQLIATPSSLAAMSSDHAFAFVLDVPPSSASSATPGSEARAVSDTTRVARVVIGRASEMPLPPPPPRPWRD